MTKRNVLGQSFLTRSTIHELLQDSHGGAASGGHGSGLGDGGCGSADSLDSLVGHRYGDSVGNEEVESRKGEADKELKDLTSRKSALDGLGHADSESRNCVVRILGLVSKMRDTLRSISRTMRA
jgi:hypothetical protein